LKGPFEVLHGRLERLSTEAHEAYEARHRGDRIPARRREVRPSG
jgi:hypothetical protein